MTYRQLKFKYNYLYNRFIFEQPLILRTETTYIDQFAYVSEFSIIIKDVDFFFVRDNYAKGKVKLYLIR